MARVDLARVLARPLIRKASDRSEKKERLVTRARTKRPLIWAIVLHEG